MVRRAIHGEQIIRIVRELHAFSRVPILGPGLPCVLQGNHVIDLHGGTRVLPACEMNHLARVRVVQHTGFHLAAVARDICHISQIARQNVLAHIAPVAVVVGLAESEQIAVIAVAIGPVHHGELVQRLRSGSSGRVSAGDLGDAVVDARQNHAEGCSDHHCDEQDDQDSLERCHSVFALESSCHTHSVNAHVRKQQSCVFPSVLLPPAFTMGTVSRDMRVRVLIVVLTRKHSEGRDSWKPLATNSTGTWRRCSRAV